MLILVNGHEVRFGYNHPISYPGVQLGQSEESDQEKSQPVLFHDCLGREIKVGDVLANGQRRGSHGGIRLGVVTGFTAKTILADILDDGHRSYYAGHDHTGEDRTWSFRKGHFNAGYNCCITGMTEMQLREITETQPDVFGEDDHE